MSLKVKIEKAQQQNIRASTIIRCPN